MKAKELSERTTEDLTELKNQAKDAEAYADSVHHPYLHLVDGGVAGTRPDRGRAPARGRGRRDRASSRRPP